LTARIAKCLNVGPASRTTASPLRGKSLTPAPRSNEGIQAIKAELTIIKKVSAMSPNGVGHVLGLNNKPGHDLCKCQGAL
jgi:hypothetical protein